MKHTHTVIQCKKMEHHMLKTYNQENGTVLFTLKNKLVAQNKKNRKNENKKFKIYVLGYGAAKLVELEGVNIYI